MIAFCGSIGTGKTYHMTKVLHKAHTKGHYVVTNYNTAFSNKICSDWEQFLEYLQSLYWAVVTKGKPLMPKGKKIYIGLDEGGVLLNSRNFRNFPPILIDFVPQMRKVGVELFYTTQSPYIIDVNFRRFTDSWKWFFKLWETAPFGWRRDYILNPESPDRMTLINGNEQLTHFPVFFFYSAKIFQLYDTFQILRTSFVNDIRNLLLEKQILQAIKSFIEKRRKLSRFSFFLKKYGSHFFHRYKHSKAARFLGRLADGQRRLTRRIRHTFGKIVGKKNFQRSSQHR